MTTVGQIEPDRSGIGRARPALQRTGDLSGNAGAFAHPTSLPRDTLSDDTQRERRDD